jgi:phosphoglycerate kinase
MRLDIGPNLVATFSSALETTQTVIWNGPMGVFEFDKFAVGTEVISQSNSSLYSENCMKRNLTLKLENTLL